MGGRWRCGGGGSGLGEFLGQAGLGVGEQLGGGGRRRRCVFAGGVVLFCGVGFGRGCVLVLSLGKKDAEPTIADKAALRVCGVGEGDAVVGADEVGVAGFLVAGFGAGVQYGDEVLQVGAVFVE